MTTSSGTNEFAPRGRNALARYYNYLQQKLGAVLAIAFASSVCIELILFYKVVIRAQENVSLKFYAFTIWLALSVLANLLWTSFSDPGFLPVVFTKHTDKKFIEFIKKPNPVKRSLLKLMNTQRIIPLKNKYKHLAVERDPNELIIDDDETIRNERTMQDHFDPESYTSSIKKGIKKLVRSLGRIPRPKRTVPCVLPETTQPYCTKCDKGQGNCNVCPPLGDTGYGMQTLPGSDTMPRLQIPLLEQYWSYSSVRPVAPFPDQQEPSPSGDSDSMGSVYSIIPEPLERKISRTRYTSTSKSPTVGGKAVTKVLEKNSIYKIICGQHQPFILKFCRTCSVWKSSSCEHCPICNRCVDYHEKHSIVFSNCLGRRNFRYYYSTLMFLTLMSIWILGNTVLHLKEIVSNDPGDNISDFLSKHRQVALIITLSTIETIVGAVHFYANTMSAIERLTQANQKLEASMRLCMPSALGDLERRYILNCMGIVGNQVPENRPQKKTIPTVLPIMQSSKKSSMTLNKARYHAVNFLHRFASYKPRSYKNTIIVLDGPNCRVP